MVVFWGFGDEVVVYYFEGGNIHEDENNHLELRFSVQYCVANKITNRTLWFDSF